MSEFGKRKRQVRYMVNSFTDYWLNDASFALLLLILLFTVFVLPVLIEYGHVHGF